MTVQLEYIPWCSLMYPEKRVFRGAVLYFVLHGAASGKIELADPQSEATHGTIGGLGGYLFVASTSA